ILTETSGVATTVNISMLDSTGQPVLKGGSPVAITQTVPPLSTVQINDADLFGDAEVQNPYALFDYQDGGSVMPFATVIDAGTEDASLRVGASVRSLTPAA